MQSQTELDAKEPPAPILGERFELALSYAVRAHCRQARKGTRISYVAHLLAVAAHALEFGADEDQAIAALLHDVVEDQGGLPRLEDVRAKFGDRVATIVADCTDAETIPKPPWRARKEAYMARLETKHPDALLVSLADKIHNAEAINADLHVHGARLWARFKGGREGTLWYYHSLSEAFERLLPGPAASRLARAVADMHSQA